MIQMTKSYWKRKQQNMEERIRLLKIEFENKKEELVVATNKVRFPLKVSDKVVIESMVKRMQELVSVCNTYVSAEEQLSEAKENLKRKPEKEAITGKKA